MAQHWKTILLVTLVSAMIWVFAEGESLRSQRVSIRLTLAPADPESELLRAPPEWTGEVTVLVQGATEGVDRFEDLAREPLVLRSGQHFPAAGGPVSLRDAIADIPRFRGLGVTIAEADPAIVTVAVDLLEAVELPVRVDAGRLDFSSPPVPDPPTARLFVPRSARSLLARDAFLSAVIPPEKAASIAPGRQERLAGIPVLAPEPLRDLPGVRAVPAQVGVTLTLRHVASEVTLASVPVHLRLSPARLQEFDVAIAPETEFLRDVTVRGPREIIARIESRELAVIAYVALSRDDLVPGTIVRQATFGDFLGEVEFDLENPSVTLTITPRSPPDPPPG